MKKWVDFFIQHYIIASFLEGKQIKVFIGGA